MVRGTFHDSGFAGTAATHRTGKIDVDACIEQGIQDGLARRNGDRAAAAMKSDLKAILHCRWSLLASFEMSDVENNRRVLAYSPTREYYFDPLLLPAAVGCIVA